MKTHTYFCPKTCCTRAASLAGDMGWTVLGSPTNPRGSRRFGGSGTAFLVPLLHSFVHLPINCRVLGGGSYFFAGEKTQNRLRPCIMVVNVF